jgi:hypothetical protein
MTGPAATTLAARSTGARVRPIPGAVPDGLLPSVSSPGAATPPPSASTAAGEAMVSVKHRLLGLFVLVFLFAPLAPLIVFAGVLLPQRTAGLATLDVVGAVIYMQVLSTLASRSERA